MLYPLGYAPRTNELQHRSTWRVQQAAMAEARFSRPVVVEVTTPKGGRKVLTLGGPSDAVHAMGQDGLGKFELGPQWQIAFNLLTRAVLRPDNPVLIERARDALIDLARNTKELRTE